MSQDVTPHHVDRRQFLRAAAGSAALVGVLPAVLRADESPTTQPAKPIATGTLGRTKFPTSSVSFGAIRIKPPAGIQLLKRAVDAGMNLIHTAPGYGGGSSVAAIGAFFKQYPEYRAKVFLCLKNSNPGTSEAHLAAVADTLAKLNTDHADIFLPTIHKPDPARLEVIVAMNDALFKQGKIKFKGFTCHGQLSEVMELILAKAPDAFDGTLMSMAPVNALGTSKSKEASEDVQKRFLANIKAIRANGVGIISMKSGARRAVGRGPKMFGPHCKQVLDAGADTVLTSFGNFTEIESAQQADLSSVAMTSRDWAIASALCNENCMMCGACTRACPQGLPVGELMRVSAYPRKADWADHAANEFAELGVSADQVASACGDCSACGGACPLGVASADRVQEVVQRFRLA